MKHKKVVSLLTALSASLLFAHGALAAVSAEEAGKLRTTLTPLGGERAGNADGSIPAWTGGYTQADPAYKDGGKRGDPFANEKPLFTITAQNMAQYADNLSAGTQAMLRKYPDSYRLEVYPSHRSAAAPQSVYDATFANATSGKLVDGPAGLMPEGAAGGIPFPIPGSGAEAIWNHLLRWRGASWHASFTQYLTTADGKHVLTNDSRADLQMPWYLPGGAGERGVFWSIRMINDGPPLRAGEAITGLENLNADKTTVWTYLPGQRRVRRLPNACCDTPTPATAGVLSFDELYVFDGRVDRFDWKLVGKKELYIPYNANKVFTAAGPEALLDAHHLKSDAIRWEKHRVWVVEATLKNGQRHVMPRSTYYLDEDTWTAVLGERYDARGQLAKALWTSPVVLPDLPGVVTLTNGFYDLLSGAWFAGDLFAGKNEQYRIVPPYKDAVFTADAMAGEGVR
ncbi:MULTISPECIES: DUF1329 domain-containing protein [unclassified Pseudomonas]|uniref:DUF1329 domain-containing protein n=1 Tax=unclassified Pseudomonas TaxID=196821 RepID=UPI0002A2C6BC|nr:MULTISPECIES: DUF1329 domain-containing protein [unclassified Pseudomonas]MBB1610362.1 hypothetical protein [Pseudomonas sp. UMC76]MBB1642084.1 hypothetical protein [Pseudomonas sp. UME83]NTX93044.1 DUF1329 domain-containing protein [Pseudomonas sp. UMA643]NTY22480.1 DUF1329 domain-containing protein [Pseudomonas sp. UMC3103]NTY28515.1 DUF1329 domain-containing protein [Pseudomonas sp. UMA603]